jgi:hypothetical protein
MEAARSRTASACRSRSRARLAASVRPRTRLGCLDPGMTSWHRPCSGRRTRSRSTRRRLPSPCWAGSISSGPRGGCGLSLDDHRDTGDTALSDVPSILAARDVHGVTVFVSSCSASLMCPPFTNYPLVDTGARDRGAGIAFSGGRSRTLGYRQPSVTKRPTFVVGFGTIAVGMKNIPPLWEFFRVSVRMSRGNPADSPRFAGCSRLFLGTSHASVPLS